MLGDRIRIRIARGAVRQELHDVSQKLAVDAGDLDVGNRWNRHAGEQSRGRAPRHVPAPFEIARAHVGTEQCPCHGADAACFATPNKHLPGLQPPPNIPSRLVSLPERHAYGLL